MDPDRGMQELLIHWLIWGWNLEDDDKPEAQEDFKTDYT